eukprot:6163891-Prymnesium_polylepis.2
MPSPLTPPPMPPAQLEASPGQWTKLQLPPGVFGPQARERHSAVWAASLGGAGVRPSGFEPRPPPVAVAAAAAYAGIPTEAGTLYRGRDSTAVVCVYAPVRTIRQDSYRGLARARCRD